MNTKLCYFCFCFPQNGSVKTMIKSTNIDRKKGIFGLSEPNRLLTKTKVMHISVLLYTWCTFTIGSQNVLN